MYSAVVILMLSAMIVCTQSQSQESEEKLVATACEVKGNETLRNQFYRMIRERHGVHNDSEAGKLHTA